MNIIALTFHYLKAKPLNTLSNVLLLSLGIAVITTLFLCMTQIQEKMEKNAQGIDLVVGAKGSPLQLILCNIFHVDFPTGNIKLIEAERIVKNKMIKEAIPIALGDSYLGYRIIGTNRRYPNLYNASLAHGAWWSNDLEAVIGANPAEQLGLKLGDKLSGSHGLVNDGDVHAEHQYVVTGILQRSNTVMDNLILCNIQSVWAMHEGEERVKALPAPDSSFKSSRLIPGVSASDTIREITSLLIKYRSPLAAIQLPRIINAQSNLQAASPAFETARLFSILGIGVDILTAFAYVIIFISALSIFIALFNSLKERKYDLAIMRSMGASRSKLFLLLLLEGCVLTAVGSLTGLVLSHSGLVIMTLTHEETQRVGISGFVFVSAESIIFMASIVLGAFCSLIPAWQAYRVDISKVLSSN